MWNNTKELDLLNLSYNELTIIRGDMFKSLHLTDLFLRRNKIAETEANAWASLGYLTDMVDLRDNQLATLNVDSSRNYLA